MTFRRLVSCVAYAMCLAAQSKIQRDWQTYPAVARISMPQEIFAVGDVHGDCQRLEKLLAAAKVIDGVPDKPHWIADTAVLVFTGDVIDKGPDALGVIALLRSLRKEAAQAGGQVVVLMGNHEAGFLADPDLDLTKDFTAQLKLAGLGAREVAACRGDLGQFLCSLPFAARVGDWFFSHAGNTEGRSLDQLDVDLRFGVDRDGFNTKELADPNSILGARVGGRGPGGKSWFEVGSPQRSADRLAAYAAALGAAHIVQGHQHNELRFPDGAQRNLGEMFQWHGLLFLIDVGMSRDIDESQGAILHVRTQAGEATAICPNGKTTPIWNAARASQSGHAKPCHL